MRTIGHILNTIVLVVVLISFGTPQSFSIGRGGMGQLSRKQSKYITKEEEKRLRKEIELNEKEVLNLLKEDFPKGVKERVLEEFKICVSQYNAFFVDNEMAPYNSPLLEQSEITEPQTASKSNEIITLIISADGPTKDEAVKNALRSAIEQAFGTFVSANTTILNDELVKDEIVTVSNGSIKDYKEISSAQIANGTYSVTLSATVSLSNLITYAKNHGSECEFAGNTFGMEMRLFEIQKENEKTALLNLNSQLRSILPKLLRWRIDIKEPRVIEPTSTKYIYDEGFAKKLATQKDGTTNATLFQRIKGMQKDDFFEVSMEIYAIMPENDFISETLKNLSIPREAFEFYKSKGLNVCDYYWYSKSGGDYDKNPLYFRNNPDDFRQLMDSISKTISIVMMDFVITDNLGKRHHLYPEDIVASANSLNCEFEGLSQLGFYYGDNINVAREFLGNRLDSRESVTVQSINDDGLFAYPIDIYATGNYYDGFDDLLKGTKIISLNHPLAGLEYPLGGITIYIPKNEIGKYSSFKIGSKE